MGTFLFDHPDPAESISPSNAAFSLRRTSGTANRPTRTTAGAPGLPAALSGS
jgi:hypothetical protein